LTLDEARGGDKLALWDDGEDEFMLDPGYGTVYWRPAVAWRGDLLGKTWREVAWDRPLPRHGWKHEPGCGCGRCRPQGPDEASPWHAPMVG
jgi:hypothetical protein